MAKTNGPLFSLNATGKIDKALIFEGWKGVNTVKEYVQPDNPQTVIQQVQRSYMGSSIALWKEGGLTDIDKIAWGFFAKRCKRTMSGMNIFNSNVINALKLGKTWNQLYNCVISDITGNGFKVVINCASDQTGKLYIGELGSIMLTGFDGVFDTDHYTFTVTGLDNFKNYMFFIANTAINEMARTGIFKVTTIGGGPPVVIEIGSPAVVGNDFWSVAGNTWLSDFSPANASGKINSVDIYAHSDMVGCKVATFYLTGVDTYSTRDSANIGAVVAGALRNFVVDINVNIGDFIGIVATSGMIRATTSGVNSRVCVGDQIPCTNAVFAETHTSILSIYGSGISS